MTRTPVRLHVRVPPGTELGPEARVRVTVEDVTMLDGPSRTLAAKSFTVPASGAEQELGPFELGAELPPGGGEYAVRVHVDRSGDGNVVEGDLVSVARHAVASELEVPVRPV